MENEKIRIWKLEKLLQAEKDKTKAYGQLMDAYTTYIAILLNRLNATKDMPVAITEEEIKGAMEQYKVMGTYNADGVKVKLYVDGVQAEVNEPPGEKEDKSESGI